MSIWNKTPTLEFITERFANNMISHIGIEITEVGDDFLKGRMPVDERTKQPAGILHGGASVALAETLGSMAANLCINTEKYYCVGLDINSNHIRIMKEGYVYGVAKPLHLGQKTQVWEIKITDEKDRLVNVSRLTMAIVENMK